MSEQRQRPILEEPRREEGPTEGSLLENCERALSEVIADYSALKSIVSQFRRKQGADPETSDQRVLFAYLMLKDNVPPRELADDALMAQGWGGAAILVPNLAEMTVEAIKDRTGGEAQNLLDVKRIERALQDVRETVELFLSPKGEEKPAAGEPEEASPSGRRRHQRHQRRKDRRMEERKRSRRPNH